jgi:hypothetical protein
LRRKFPRGRSGSPHRMFEYLDSSVLTLSANFEVGTGVKIYMGLTHSLLTQIPKFKVYGARNLGSNSDIPLIVNSVTYVLNTQLSSEVPGRLCRVNFNSETISPPIKKILLRHGLLSPQSDGHVPGYQPFQVDTIRLRPTPGVQRHSVSAQACLRHQHTDRWSLSSFEGR